MESKKWFESKTLWVNLIAVVGDIVLRFTGHALPEGYDVVALGIINAILRFVTKKPVVF